MAPGLSIVLLGNSGVGKSASGNTILGRPAFESKRAFRSVTTKISEETETVFGQQISVIDTPVIFGSEREIQRWCQELLQSSTPCLFLVVVKIDRFTIEQKNAVEKAISTIGDQGFNNCYLLFTGGDDLQNTSVEDFINDDPEGPLPPLVERFAGRHHVFNNENGEREQVRELLMKSGHLRPDQQPDPPDAAAGGSEERRIVLLGLPGHGKSSSGNTILGSEQFESAAGFNAVTTASVCKSGVVEGRRFKVVDTPGFTGANALTPRKLFEEIMESVVMAHPGPHGFILVVKIDRINEADVKLLEMLPTLFSRDAPQHAMVLFTHGERLGRGQTMDELIESNGLMRKLVSMCGGRYCVFNNTDRGNRRQVRNLLDQIDRMVTGNNGQHYTSEMFSSSQDMEEMFSSSQDRREKIDSRWHKIGEWFIRMLKELDCCGLLSRPRQDGYSELQPLS